MGKKERSMRKFKPYDRFDFIRADLATEALLREYEEYANR